MGTSQLLIVFCSSVVDEVQATPTQSAAKARFYEAQYSMNWLELHVCAPSAAVSASKYKKNMVLVQVVR
jgi:hypothetical protein